MILTAEEFVRLRNSEMPELYSLAATLDANETVWLDVIRDYPEMKIWVAHNKTIQLGILRILADDGDRQVRSIVASKRKLNAELFEKLAQDPDEGVRNAIACNAKAPVTVLETLAQDVCAFVRDNAQQRLAKRG